MKGLAGDGDTDAAFAMHRDKGHSAGPARGFTTCLLRLRIGIVAAPRPPWHDCFQTGLRNADMAGLFIHMKTISRRRAALLLTAMLSSLADNSFAGEPDAMAATESAKQLTVAEGL